MALMSRSVLLEFIAITFRYVVLFLPFSPETSLLPIIPWQVIDCCFELPPPPAVPAGLVSPKLQKTMNTNAYMRCNLSTLNWDNSLITCSIQHPNLCGMMVALRIWWDQRNQQGVDTNGIHTAQSELEIYQLLYPRHPFQMFSRCNLGRACGL